MHPECIKGLVSTAREGMNDGITTSKLRCPLCRDGTVLEAWGTAFDFQAQVGEATEHTMQYAQQMAAAVVRHIMQNSPAIPINDPADAGQADADSNQAIPYVRPVIHRQQ
jgi:hypothetical protein